MDQPPANVLEQWNISAAKCEPIHSGHINCTFLLVAPKGKFVLQRLHRVFSAEVNLDIDAVTSWVAMQGMFLPRLVPSRQGKLWFEEESGAIWRMLTYVEGECLLAADSPERCLQAGRLLGRFHRAAWNCPHEFRFVRLGVHDTRRHLAGLEKALREYAHHRLFREAKVLAAEIIRAAAGLDLDTIGRLPSRLVHGDPKISNVLFSPTGEAITLIDLDTFGRLPLAVELGDALRSWCCPRGEDAPLEFRLDFCAAALAGWRETIGGLPQLEEILAIPQLVEIIALELSARFCADALRESYFAFDPQRYPAAGEHNLARARSQLALAVEVGSQQDKLRQLVEKA